MAVVRSGRGARGLLQIWRSAGGAALILFGLGLSGAPARDVRADESAAHAHHHMAADPTTRRSVIAYQIPDVKMVRDDGRSVSLVHEMDDGRPVVLAFIYTTCTTVCPLTSATLSELQRKLDASSHSAHLVSISIDPEQDTPARLHEYAAKFGAGPAWQHYTGTLAASQTVQRAFDVYRGSKMDHAAVSLVRASPGDAWVRVEGFATSDQLMAELSGAPARK
jgi:protein SCO1/2